MSKPRVRPENTDLELLQLHATVLSTLCSRGVLRSVNNPAADYAEYLVRLALRLQSAPPSTKGYDLVDSRGKRYEVKARRYTSRSKPTRFSAIRQLEAQHFHFLVVVLFDEDFTVRRGIVLPYGYVRRKAFLQAHVNGWILPLDEELLSRGSGRDVTTLLR